MSFTSEKFSSIAKPGSLSNQSTFVPLQLFLILTWIGTMPCAAPKIEPTFAWSETG